MKRGTRILAGLLIFAFFVWAVGRVADAEAHPVSVWIKMADCETGDGDGRYPYRADWSYNGRSGFDGGLQFSPGTWKMARKLVGVHYRYAYQAPASTQIRVAEAWLHRTSWRQWPACSRKLGLR